MNTTMTCQSHPVLHHTQSTKRIKTICEYFYSDFKVRFLRLKSELQKVISSVFLLQSFKSEF